MASTPTHQPPKLDRYVVIHVATTCDEHGVYVTKDSAEVIEIGWILLDAQKCDEVCAMACIRAVADTMKTDRSRQRARQTRQHAHHASVQSVPATTQQLQPD